MRTFPAKLGGKHQRWGSLDWKDGPYECVREGLYLTCGGTAQHGSPAEPQRYALEDSSVLCNRGFGRKPWCSHDAHRKGCRCQPYFPWWMHATAQGHLKETPPNPWKSPKQRSQPSPHFDVKRQLCSAHSLRKWGSLVREGTRQGWGWSLIGK